MSLDPRLRLRHLRCFLAVASSGSVAEAAAGLHITQPAVSKTLRDLESILGADLFDRSTRRLRLNDAGRMFQGVAGGAVADLARAQATLKGLTRARTTLAVGVLPTAATDLVPRAALTFAAAHPHCVLRATTGPNELLLSQLRDARLDIVVGRMAAPDQMAGLSFEQLYAEDIVLVARPGHPLLSGAGAAADVAAFPLILPPPGAVIAQTVHSHLISIGLSHVRPLFETVSLAFGRRVVQLSDALWFISEGVVADELAQGTLVRLPLAGPMLAGPVGLSLRGDGAPMPERDGLVAALRAAAREAGG